jgi:NADH-quinone oxidoreductase subunit J
MELAVFALFGLAALVSAIVVIAHRNPVYSTMSLVVTLVSTAVLFVLLGSPFLAALQILLYTGAILVLFLFVIMLLNVGRERASGEDPRLRTGVAAALAFALAGALGRLLWAAHGEQVAPELDAEFVSLRGVSEQLFSTYLLPFEIIGLLLLVAVVAASWVARREEGEAEPDEPAAPGPTPPGSPAP